MKYQILILTSAITAACVMRVHAGDEKITLGQVPANIQKAIKKQAGSNEIIRIEKATEHDQVQYEALTKKSDGKKIEFILNSDGSLDATEESISKEELPGAVAKTVGNTVADGKIHGIERITKKGTVTYEVGYKSSKGEKQEAVISSGGKLLENGEDKD